ncbi:hypothetical protein WME94_30280 [Sorangium sp. So ce429]
MKAYHWTAAVLLSLAGIAGCIAAEPSPEHEDTTDDITEAEQAIGGQFCETTWYSGPDYTEEVGACAGGCGWGRVCQGQRTSYQRSYCEPCPGSEPPIEPPPNRWE